MSIDYRMPKEIVVDNLKGEIRVDDFPLPWFIALDMEVKANPSDIAGLRLTIMADRVTVISSTGEASSVTTDELIEAGFNKETTA